MNRPVLIMAGGTGGHIFPGLAVAEWLRRQDVPVIWLGSRAGLENRLVPDRGITLERLSISGLRGTSLGRKLLAPFRLMRALFQAIAVLRRHNPRSVLSMGGFAAGPGGLAAWLLRKPLVVHEQNSIPGLTNRILARLARRVLAGFPGAFPGIGEYVGNPVRADIAELPAPEQRLADRRGPVHLLVLGGSQGALSLNRLLPEALAQMDPERRPQVIHQLGEKHLQAGQAAYAAGEVQAELVPFIEDMSDAYRWADLVVCRAGALTVAELMAAGVASIMVPFPFAVDDHQTHNAGFLVSAGAAEMFQERELNAKALARRLTALCDDRELLARMAARARKLGQKDAARRVADVCLEMAA